MTPEKHGILKLTEIDNLDDRKEIFYLLTLLTVEERLKFLTYTVQVINQGIMLKHDPPHVLLTVTQETGSVPESYLDLMFAVGKHNIPVQAILIGLVDYAKKLDKMLANSRQEAMKIPLENLLG